MLKFSDYLVEASKPRVRVTPSGQMVAAPTQDLKMPRRRKPNPMVAAKQDPNYQTYPSGNTLVNTNRDTVEFDPKAVGAQQRPRQQVKAGDSPARPTSISPQQASNQKVLKQQLQSKQSGQPPGSQTSKQVLDQIRTIATQAKQNGNDAQLDQLLQLVNSVRSGSLQGRRDIRINPEREARKAAARIYRQTLRRDPNFTSRVMQDLNQMVKSGGKL